MIRPVAIVAVLALLWVAFAHPDQLVAFLAGFALGVAIVASMPRFVAWGQRIARDTEGTGGHGVRIPVHVESSPDAMLDGLERSGAAAAAACLAAGVPASYVPPDRKGAD